MTTKGKRFRWMESSDNKFIYNFAFYQYNKSITINLCININQYVQKKQIIGTYIQNQLTCQLNIPFSGRILKLYPITQASKVDLFLFQKCDHKPKQNPNNSIDKCIHCDEQLWSYQSQEIQEFCRKDFKQVKQPQAEIQWKIKLNQHFGHKQVIGLIGESEIVLGFSGRAVYLSTTTQRNACILKVRSTICKHQKIIQNLCCFCYVYIQNVGKVPIIAQTNGIVQSGRALQKVENEIIQKLLQQKKIILILDLDNTIIHCQQVPGYIQYLPMIQDYFVIPFSQYVIKIRPFLKQFIRQMLGLFDIYIYTKATREYAQNVCNYIRTQYKELFENKQYDDYFTPKRIISRDQDSSIYEKSVKNILTRDDYVIVLDDRKDVWKYSSAVVQTKEYKFFLRNAENQLILTKVNDPYLYYTKKYLIDFHKKYFELRSKKKQINVKKLNKILKHQRLRFLKVIFLFDKANKNFRHALQMGVEQFKQNKEQNTKPDLILYSENSIQKDYKYYSNVLKVPIVHEFWIDYCYQYNYRFKTDMFVIHEQDRLSKQKFEQKQAFQQQLFASNLLDI